MKIHRPVKLGDVFGRRKVVGPFLVKNRHRYWPVKCVCGSIGYVRADWLFTTDTCGCLKSVTHGMAPFRNHSPEYTAYYSMLRRCSDAKHREWHNYGGRGIRVCDRWLESFHNFFDDVGRRPSHRHTIERIDTNGNYEPENVRWATQQEQGRNRRNNRIITINGKSRCAVEWDEIMGFPKFTVSARLAKGWSEYDAVTKPRNMCHSRQMKQFYKRVS